MLFPETDRVLYDNNPLQQVICQLRYPAILKIGENAPAEFQEKLRKQYPLYQEKMQPSVVDSQEVLSQLLLDVPSALAATKLARAYELSSANNRWVLSLTKDFLALTTQSYIKWEEYRKHIVEPFKTFASLYEPPFLTRIGLRYQNIIQRSRLNLEGVNWSELLNPHIAGVLADQEVSNGVDQIAQQILIGIDRYQAKVRINHALGINTETKEPIYAIDNDFFTDQQTEVKDVPRILDYFNQQNRLLFRWAISERLHEAMGPRNLPNISKSRSRAITSENS